MKKFRIFLFLLLLLLWPVKAGAQELFSENELLQESGLDDAIYDLPQQTQNDLEDLGVFPIRIEALLSLSPKKVLQAFIDHLRAELHAPLASFLSAAGMILLWVVFCGLGQGFLSKKLSSVFSVSIILCVTLDIAPSVVACMLHMKEVVETGSRFMVAFIPIFTAAVTAAGQPVLAGGYSAVLLVAAETITQQFSLIILPLLFLYMGLSVVFCIVPDLSLGGIAKTLRSAATWFLSLSLVIFVGLLSLQGVLAASADSVTVRAAKFAIGSLLPVVGGSVAEAFTTVMGSMGLIKSGIGIYGILVFVILFLPVLAEGAVWIMVTKFLAAAAEMFQQKQVTQVMTGLSQTLSVTMSVVICFMIMLIISTALVLSMKGGV